MFLVMPHRLLIIVTPQDVVACNANSNYRIMFPRHVLDDGPFSPDPFCLRERLPVLPYPRVAVAFEQPYLYVQAESPCYHLRHSGHPAHRKILV